MRILMLTWEYPPRIVGGIARVVYNLSVNMSKMGHRVTVLTSSEDVKRHEYECDGNLEIIRTDFGWIKPIGLIDNIMQMNMKMISAIIRRLNAEKEFDVIHVHDWVTAFVGLALRDIYHYPMITTIHATESGRNHGIHTEMQKYIHNVETNIIQVSKQIICNSQYMKDEIMSLFSTEEDKISVIPNGINLNRFCDQKSIDYRRSIATDEEKIVMFIGRIVCEKGIYILLEAAKIALARNNKIKFVIAGKGPELENAKNWTREKGIENKVLFTGYISDEDVSLLYCSADIAVFPSLYEPFGIVALEAMAANIPVIVSETGGLIEIVKNNKTGLKFTPGDFYYLAECIINLINDEAKCKLLATNAFDEIKNNYSWEAISHSTIETYKKMIYQSNSWL